MADTGFVRTTDAMRNGNPVISVGNTCDNNIATSATFTFTTGLENFHVLWGSSTALALVSADKIIVGIELRLRYVTILGTATIINKSASQTVAAGSPVTYQEADSTDISSGVDPTLLVIGGPTDLFGIPLPVTKAQYTAGVPWQGVQISATAGTVFKLYEVEMNIYYDDPPPPTEAHPNAYWIHKLTN